MPLRGNRAPAGIALAIAVPLIPCLAYLTSGQPPASRGLPARCYTIPSSPALCGPGSLPTGAAQCGPPSAQLVVTLDSSPAMHLAPGHHSNGAAVKGGGR
jgi:hypothetical protein